MFILPYLAFFSVFISRPTDLLVLPQLRRMGPFFPTRSGSASKTNKQLLFDDNRFTVTAKNTVTFVRPKCPAADHRPADVRADPEPPFRGGPGRLSRSCRSRFCLSCPSCGCGAGSRNQSGLINYYLDASRLGEASVAVGSEQSHVDAGAYHSVVDIRLHTILLLAGLQDIPGELYEAAEVDGASPLSRFRFITLPLLRDKLRAGGALAFIGCSRCSIRRTF